MLHWRFNRRDVQRDLIPSHIKNVVHKQKEITTMIDIKFSDTMTANEVEENIIRLKEAKQPLTKEEEKAMDSFANILRAALIYKESTAREFLVGFGKYLQDKCSN